MTKIFVDSRETRSLVKDSLINKKLPIEIKQLDIGDYIITNGDINVIIERKEVNDYISSLVSGKLNNQLYELSSNADYGMLIIEGFLNEALIHRRIKKSQVNSSIAGAMLRRSPDGKQGTISVLTVEGPFDTADIIAGIYKRFEEDEGFIRLPQLERIKVTPAKRAIMILASFPDIGEGKATKLINHFGNLKNVLTASKEELCKVKGIGEKIAEKIQKTLLGENKE
jgi:ERCC4-type nuclease